MRSDIPAVAPFLRSDNQRRILAEILLADRELTLSEVAHATQVPAPTVQREVDRLAEAGIIAARKQGRNRLVSANDSYPLMAPLVQIITATYGTTPVIRDVFSGLVGLDHLIVFGSWASRLSGIHGRFPGDVDVLLVGADVSHLDAYRRAEAARARIGREVNPPVVSPARWQSADDGFIREIKSQPYVELEVNHVS
jgi:DNA-binding transcriptional ArsR family regulator